MRLIFIILSVILPAFSLCAQTSQPILVKVGKLYLADKKKFITNQQILIADGLIQEVGLKVKKPKGTQEINLSSCTVTPGLIDMHTHLLFHQSQAKGSFEAASKVPADERVERGLKFAKECLESGITTVRDLGNSGQYLDVRLQKELTRQKGALMLVASGPILSPPGGQFFRISAADSYLVDQEYSVIRSAEDARKAVEDHAEKGAKVIKICANTDEGTLTREQMLAIVEAAHKHKLTVTAHSTGDQSARDAVLAGVDGIEHGYTLSDSTLSLMAQKGTYLVPTDISWAHGKIMVDGIGMKGQEAEKYLKDNLNAMHDRLNRAVAKGVTIVFGSDFYSDIPGAERGKWSTDVLVSYHEAGLPVSEVIGFATRNAAEKLGLANTLGYIRKGMKADLVFFNGDLEKDFAKSLGDVKMVLKDGVQVK